jgi:general secretion pathway protein D
VTIADSSNSALGGGNTGGADSSGGSRTGISIESNDEFQFWRTVESEIHRILMGAADGGIHYTRAGDSWIGPDGKKWEYNPLAPIVNASAGMVTVTGTDRQVNRVARYINTLKKQLKTQVLIDVRILTVTFDDSTTTGVDWSQLYGLQNLTINSLAMGQRNIASYTSGGIGGGIGDVTYAPGTEPKSARLFEAKGTAEVSDVVKFLATQGDVRSVSSPRVMTLNNQPALISVGKELFYKIKSSTTLGGQGGATAATEGEYVDSVFAGVLLDITPEIDSGGMITLKINPSITDTLAPLETGNGVARSIPPDMIKRQIASVIKVKDGHHAILGGLISSQTGTKVNKVPLLGDLPLLEYAFKHEEKIEKVVELVMIITPHIVSNSKDVSLRDLGYKRVNGK